MNDITKKLGKALYLALLIGAAFYGYTVALTEGIGQVATIAGFIVLGIIVLFGHEAEGAAMLLILLAAFFLAFFLGGLVHVFLQEVVFNQELLSKMKEAYNLNY